MAERVVADLVAYSAQIACVTALGSLLAVVLKVDTPRVRHAFWRLLLALCLLLPFLQGRQHALSGVTDATAVSSSVSVLLTQTTTTVQRLPAGWAALLGILLMAGAAARLIWMLVSLLRLRRLRTAGQAETPSAEHIELQATLGTGAEIRCVSGLRQPVTFGARHPLVLLPESLRTQPADIQRAVLCHELLHVKRRDWVWVILEEMVRAVLWFHPAVWWLISRIQLSREEVVDALVVVAIGERRTYIKALLAFADETPLAPATAFSRRRHLFQRMMLLSKETVMSSKRVILSSGVMALVVCAGSWYTVRAFPLTEAAGVQAAQGGPAGVGLPPQAPGPLERRTNPVTPENPIPRCQSALPRYPQSAMSSRIQATVSLAVTLDETGRVAEVRSIMVSLFGGDNPANNVVPASGVSAISFVQAAADALRQWQCDAPVKAPLTFLIGMRFPPDSDAILTNASGAAPAGPPPAWHEGAARAGDGIMPPRKVKDVRPLYPPDAQAAQVQGIVILEVRIEPDGRVSHTRVMRSIPLLDQAAMDAVAQWEFEPPVKVNAEPVPVIMVVTINFTLQ